PPGGVDERRAEGRRRELEPVPCRGRPDRGRARRARAWSRAAGAGRGRSRDDRRARARSPRDRPAARDAGTGARRARKRRGADRRARPGAGGVVSRRPQVRVGRLLARRRDIRAAGPLLQVLNEVPLVDQPAHGLLRGRPSLDEFRGLFSESPDPRQWPQVATGVTYRRAIRELAEFLGCEPAEEAVLERRLGTDFGEYAAGLLRATNAGAIYVDDGYPTGDSVDWQGLGGLAGCDTRPGLRLEDRGEGATGGAAAARQDGFR